jgi:serine/threonine-protein kinase
MTGRVVLGRYRIVAPLARGGMGIIYLGRLEGAAGFSKPVVIKTVIPDAKDTRAAQLFVREARILSNLEHPNIVGVLDFGEVDGEYIMVLEYVHGFHLGFWARYVKEARGALPVQHAVEVMLPVLDALEFAHSLKRPDGTPLGIVHRDISPANILLDQAGHVKLHDFGIARMADDEFKTQDGTFRGTLSFTAPETLQGEPATARSDLYACGVILYQLLAGANPFRGEQPSETLHRVVTHVPPLVSTLRDDVDAALASTLARSLEKEPAKRFDSAGSFAAALRACRTWSETDAGAELARVIHEDFASPEMPQRLGIETLQTRDASWRAALPSKQQTPLRSSHPPGAPAGRAMEPMSRAPEATATGNVASGESLGRANANAARLVATAQPTRAEAPVTVPAPALTRRRRRLSVWLGLGGLALVLATGTLLYSLLSKQTAPPPPRFLLIEKQADAEPEPAPSAAADAPPAAPTAITQPGGALPTAAPKPAPAADVATARSSGSALTSAFQKQRGRVESCFRQNPSDATPQLTLRFQLDANGTVRTAELSPSAVAASPLGSCILGVARGTRFPPSNAPVSFTIPITARKSAG